MDSVSQLMVSSAAFPEAEMPEEEIRPAVKYIMRGRSYTARVARANASGFTFLPPYDCRPLPRPMTKLDRFLGGGWRRGSWEAYISKESHNGRSPARDRSRPKMGLKRRLTLAFVGALLADIALSFIIWLSLMMGISVFDLESKWGLQIDAFKLLTGTFVILFVLLFLALLALIRPRKIKS